MHRIKLALAEAADHAEWGAEWRGGALSLGWWQEAHLAWETELPQVIWHAAWCRMPQVAELAVCCMLHAAGGVTWCVPCCIYHVSCVMCHMSCVM